jgi:hypothetical protein
MTFADMAIFNGTSRTFSGEGDPERVASGHVIAARPGSGRGAED